MPWPTKPFSEWKKEDLDSLLGESPAVESARVDFKAECNVLSGEDAKREKARRDLLVDVASMANGAGGALLIGVRQSGDTEKPPEAASIDGIVKPQKLIQTINGLVDAHLVVHPAALRPHVIPWKGTASVLIVEVPENLYSLTMVTYGRLNQFWIRRGWDNRPMTTDEIEYRFGRFAKVRSDASDELEKLHRRALEGDFNPRVWFGAVPLARARDHVPVNVADIKNMLGGSRYFSDYEDRGKNRGAYTPRKYSEELRPSLCGIDRRPKEAGRHAVLEIGRDGSFVFAPKLSRPQSQATSGGGQSPGQVYLVQIYEPILSGLYAFADMQDHFGMGKAALAQAGVYDVQNTAVVRGREFDDGLFPKLFEVLEVALDAVTLGEHWQPQQIFLEWATQLANALHLPEAIPLDPWIPASGTGS